MENTPIFDGLTQYSDFKNSELTCPKGLGYGTEIDNLDTSMADRNGLYRSFGRGRRRFSRGPRFGLNLTKFRSLSSRFGSGLGRRRSFNRRRFGRLPQIGSLGLPEGTESANTINETYPQLFTGGAPLPRPYGPRDNLELLSRFGRRRRSRGFGLGRRRSFGPMGFSRPRRFSRPRKLHRRSFGFSEDPTGGSLPGPSSMTPGTPGWVQNLGQQDFSGQEYARPYLESAKGFVKPTINYYNKPGTTTNNELMYAISNTPMQYSDNAANTPLFTNKPAFGRKNRRSFGAFSTTDAFTGPNQVAYNKPVPMYHGGSNTINWQTNQAYLPDMVPGNILGVQPDNLTPGAFLEKATTIDVASSPKFRPNTANTYTSNGLGTLNPVSFGKRRASLTSKKRSFGSQNRRSFGSQNRRSFGHNGSGDSAVYTPELVTSGTGDQVLYQQEPPYMAVKKNIVNGDFVGFGRKRSLRKFSGPTKPAKKALTTRFGGATITLQNGKVFVKD